MRILVFTLGLMLTLALAAQKPFINNLDKISGTAGETVTITGNGFNTGGGAIRVYFGTALSPTTTASSSGLIEAEVPPSATSGPITVFNTSSRLSGTSTQVFTLAFSGVVNNDFGTRDLNPTILLGGTNFLAYDLCMCDFDGDDDLDVAITHNDDGSNRVRIALNNSNLTTTQFTTINDLTIGRATFNIVCGDLNGNGRSDLVITSDKGNERYLYIYENTGGANFTQRAEYLAPDLPDATNRQLKKVQLADIDADGKLDVIVGNQIDGDNTLLIYLNNSGANVNFPNSPIEVVVDGANNTGGFDVGDLNGDGKPDLAVVPFRQPGNLFILENQSVPGTISFGAAQTYGANVQRLNVRIGDFNNDGQNDVATTRTADLEVFTNSNFSFSSATVNTGGNSLQPWGLDLGDLDGDGRLDIIFGSVGNTNRGVGIALNNGSGFDPIFVIATNAARNVQVGDLNGDGKPDIAFTERSLTGFQGELRTITNRNCFQPVLSFPNTFYCTGSDLIVSSNLNPAVTYSWTVGGSPAGSGTFVNLTAESASPLNVQVTVTEDDGFGCSTSANQSFTRDPDTTSPPSFISTDNNPCLGDNITLTASGSGASTYYFTLPDGTTTSNGTGTLALNNIQVDQSGTYEVYFDKGANGCASPVGTLTITVQSPPANSVIEAEDCNDGDVTLSVPDFSSQFNYQWKRNGSNVGGATNASLVVDASTNSGNYTVVITDASSLCSFETSAFTLASAPSSSFTGATEACGDGNTTYDFTATSTGQGGLTLAYTWEVENPGGTITTLSGTNISPTFDTPGTWIVRLITEYEETAGCSTASQNVTVSTPPTLNIISVSGDIEKCPNETLDLSIDNLSGVLSVTWDDPNNTVSNTLAAQIPQGQTSRQFTAIVALTNGCNVSTPAFEISNFANAGIFLDPGPDNTLVNDTLTLNDGQSTVDLTASNSLDGTYTWSTVPDGIIAGNPTGPTVSFVATQPLIALSVTATDAANCLTTTTIFIEGGGLRPRKSFSPNGDGQNDVWEIVNASGLIGCTIHIIDGRGVTLAEISSDDLTGDEVWDGNVNGSPAPEGVYYFVVKCDESSNNLTGAILLAR